MMEAYNAGLVAGRAAAVNEGDQAGRKVAVYYMSNLKNN
jgi:hypothetical protein